MRKRGEKVMFNYGLLVGARLKTNISRFDFAQLLGISYSYLRKIENGIREPSLDLLWKISKFTGIPPGDFLRRCDDECVPGQMNGPEKITPIVALSRDICREKFIRKTLEDRVSELGKHMIHALAVNEFQEKYISILRQKLPATEEAKRVAALARESARAGELCFDEIQAGLHLLRRTLEGYLESVKMTYSCKLFPEKTAIASTPGGAGMQLACFDCEAQEKELCRGYGGLNYPENFVMLVNMFEAHGIHNREEQTQILQRSFDKDISAHKLSEMISRVKQGKTVPDDLFYLKGAEIK
jgi:transcriptional regulator with XRE-family HTH domain